MSTASISVHLREDTGLRLSKLDAEDSTHSLQVGEEMTIFLWPDGFRRLYDRLKKSPMADPLKEFHLALDIVREQRGYPRRRRV